MAIATSIIVAGAIAAGASAASSAYQAHKAGEAAKLQAKGTADALSYEKERDVYARGTEANRYGALMGQTAPYRGTGEAANTRMGDLLGLPPAPPPPAGPPGGAAQPAPAGAMVAMQAPDGTTKNVPASEREHWLSKGAKQVG